jgi:uracil phosphoribosyltransferase/adenylate kinase/phosphoserine phosphatase
MNDIKPTLEKSTKPTIIGLYGVSGSGKSYLLEKLRNDSNFEPDQYVFYDGSALMEEVVEGGLNAFKQMDDERRHHGREQAILKAATICSQTGKVGVVAGHHIFWNKDEGAVTVGTKKDWQTYTHIIYLNVDVEIIAKRRQEDQERTRTELSVDDLKQWQHAEVTKLRDICLAHRILFTTLTESSSTAEGTTFERLKLLLNEFRSNDETSNTTAVISAVDATLPVQDDLETVFLLDADKTLTEFDTGLMFWGGKRDVSGGNGECPLTRIFKAQKHSYTAFRQAMLLYEEKADEFDDICGLVAELIQMHPDMTKLLRRLGAEPHVRAFIITCGLRRVWELVLQRYRIKNVEIIGGGRLADGYVVTGQTKGAVVDHLHSKKLRILAFGDSPLDMDMFEKADEAYVIVGREPNRSSSMDKSLTKAITEDRLSALQISLPGISPPRLTLEELPKVRLDKEELDFIFRSRKDPTTRFHHATSKPAAKILMTPTRDASNASHSLRKAHERVGYYLANEYLGSVFGLEEICIPHVQGNQTSGHRFRHEKATLIILLMRGGEPMAFGVSEAMPRAVFCHAKEFSDITDKKIFQGKRNVVLVDSVINTGKSLVDFITPLRKLCPHIRIVVVTGVVQADAVVVKPEGDNKFAELLRDDRELYVVALRKSDNKYKGKGSTETGHRLFNTTDLD